MGFFKNRWVRRLAVLLSIELVLSLVVTLDVMAAPLKCAPVEIETWDCDLETFDSNVKKCEPLSPVAHRDPVWRNFNSREEVYGLLREKYGKFESAIEFANWLNCEGFRVTANATAKSQTVESLDVNYFRKNIIPYALPWYDPLSWIGWYDSEAFVIDLNERGQIQRIETWFRN